MSTFHVGQPVGTPTGHSTKKPQRTAHDEPIFNIKLKEDDKYRENGRWFREYIDYLVPYDTTVVSNYHDMKKAYELVNNNISSFQEELQWFCSPIGEEETNTTFKAEHLLPYNLLHNKINVLSRQVLKRGDNFRAYLLGDKGNKELDEQMRQAIMASIEELIQIKVEQIRLQQQGMTDEEVEEYYNQMRSLHEPEDIAQKEWRSDWEIFYNHALKFCYHHNSIKNAKVDSFKHMLAAGRLFLYVGWEYGEPTIKVLNPLHCGFHKSPDVAYVEKGDYFWHKQAITIADVYNEYGNILKPEIIENLGIYNYSSELRVNQNHDVLGNRARKVFDNTTEEMFRHSQDIHDKSVGQAQGSGTNRKYHNTRLLWKTHIEFKAYREVVFLSYIDEYGKEITEVMPIEYTIPKEATKIKFINKYRQTSVKHEWVDDFGVQYSAETLWIPRRYEVTRLGQDVYVDWREVPNQPIDLENPYRNFELSYKGRIIDNMNSDPISPVQRAMPFVFQGFFVKHLQNREMAKYQGYVMDIDVDQIPDYLHLDENGQRIPNRDKVVVWRHYLKKLGYNFYSGSQQADGILPSTRAPGSRSSLTGTAQEIIVLEQLYELIGREVGMSLGVSPQREAQFSANSNVADNQNAIAQSFDITEIYYFMHDEVWRRALNDYLRLFRMYCKEIFESSPEKKEHFLYYITPNGTKELFKVTPELLDHVNIGLYLSNSGQDQFYRDTMMQLTHAFGQNAAEGMEAISDMVQMVARGASPEEIHKAIQVNMQKQQERMAQLEQAKAEAVMKQERRQDQVREDEQSHELQKVVLEGDIEKEIKAMDVYKFQEDLNQDQDGIPDPLEAAALQHKMNLENREQSRKEVETRIKSQEVSNKARKDREDTQTKRQEVRSKANQKKKT